MSDTSVIIAGQSVASALPDDGTPTEIVAAAMKEVVDRGHTHFWMLHRVDDDTRFRAAVSALLFRWKEEPALYERVAAEIRVLGAFEKALNGAALLPLDALECEGEPLGLLQAYREASGRGNRS